MQVDTDLAKRVFASSSSDEAKIDLKKLARTIRSLDSVPSLEMLNSWLRDFEVTWEQLRPFVSFKPGTYARHIVARGEHAEILLLCWKPGQRTPIHDHDGSIGAVRVCRGIMWETMFQLDDSGTLRYSSARDWRAGDITGADVPDIHQLGNPEVSGEDLVTLHIYAPPLGVLNTYKVGSAEVGHYSPHDYVDGAGI
jgi:cysteine dioxygenase